MNIKITLVLVITIGAVLALGDPVSVGVSGLGEPNVNILQVHVTGKVKWFNKSRGFGYLTRDDGARDVYFHVSGLKKGVDPDSLAVGVRVEFDVVATNKGAVAKNIAIIGSDD